MGSSPVTLVFCISCRPNCFGFTFTDFWSYILLSAKKWLSFSLKSSHPLRISWKGISRKPSLKVPALYTLQTPATMGWACFLCKLLWNAHLLCWPSNTAPLGILSYFGPNSLRVEPLFLAFHPSVQHSAWSAIDAEWWKEDKNVRSWRQMI